MKPTYEDLVQTLEDIAFHSCGCSHVCQCNGQYALEIRCDAMMDTAREMLERVRGEIPPPMKRVVMEGPARPPPPPPATPEQRRAAIHIVKGVPCEG